jgi:hypothetical protein
MFASILAASHMHFRRVSSNQLMCSDGHCVYLDARRAVVIASAEDCEHAGAQAEATKAATDLA